MSYVTPTAAMVTRHGSYQRTSIGAYRLLPMLIGMSYLVVTFILFLVWPVNWPIYKATSWLTLIGYIALCFSFLAWFFSIGSKRPGPPAEGFAWRIVLVSGAVLSIILLFPISYVYTDRWPWEVFDALGEQGEAYSTLQLQLLETEGQRGPLAAIRALSAPLTFAVLPFGILHWRNLSWLLRLLVVLSVFTIIILSVLRGTDREFADIFIIASSSLLILVARQSAQGGKGVEIIRKYWKAAVLILVFLGLAASLFTDRKSARIGGFESRTTICANESAICADIDAPAIRWMPLSQRFGLSFFILSTTSGFYGLTLALEKDFQSTYGAGHSPAALAVYELVTGDRQLAARSYTYRNAYDGWSEENYWSSLITWIANDVGFIGAVLFLALLGFIWGKAWIAATYGSSDPAAIIFCLAMIMIVYLPANNQLFASYDGYTIFFTWLVIWMTGLGTDKKSREI